MKIARYKKIKEKIIREKWNLTVFVPYKNNFRSISNDKDKLNQKNNDLESNVKRNTSVSILLSCE